MKKRLFALCAMGMVMLSGCGSSGTAPAEVADNAATGGAAAVETYTPVESVASESSMDYGFSEPAAAAAEAPASAAAKMDTTGVKQPNGGTGTQQPGLSGVLTAAEYSDLENWDFFKELVQDQKISFPAYGLDPTNAVSVTVTDNNQQPLAGETVTLLDGQGATLWETITDGEGKAWLFYDTNATPATVSTGGQDIAFADEVSFVSSSSVQQDTGLQVMFILDTTGSMGDELHYLQAEMKDVISRATEATGGLAIRTGAVVYRDHNDEYLTRISRLTNNIKETQSFIDKQQANGGGDYPEAVPEALMAAMNSAGWDPLARARIAFLILDAPCHQDSATIALLHEQILNAAALGVRIVPVVCSGLGESGELLLRSMALATNGTSFFLTDDSGIGHSHLKPTTDSLKVEHLNDMLVRTIVEFSSMPSCDPSEFTEDVSEEIEQFLPNPFKAEDIERDPSIPHGEGVHYLMDVSGKLITIFEGELSDLQAQIVRMGLPIGVYFVKTFSEGEWHTEKVLIR